MIRDLREELFMREVIQSERPVLVDFWAPWCSPCMAMAPVLDDLSAEYEGKLSVFKTNVDENPGLAARNGVRGIPTLIFFSGGREKKRLIGVQPKERLVEIVAELVSE